MTTSGVTSYSCTELDIIEAAMENIGKLAAGETMSAEDILVCRRRLNMIYKQWVSQVDFAPGLKMWCRRTGWLFLQKDQVAYSLGPSGDECASETYYHTTLSANASSGASTITVASITGLASAMRIGVKLTSGSMQWTTINGTPSGSTVTLTATLTGAAASGGVVYAYTSKILRPFELLTANIRDSSGNDAMKFDVNMLLEEYESIPSKSATGTPSRGYFEAKKTNTTLFLDCAPDDLTNVLRIRFQSYIEDTTATTQDVDFPAEWLRPLAYQLAIDLCVPYRRQITPEMKLSRDESLAIAKNAYSAKSVISYDYSPDVY